MIPPTFAVHPVGWSPSSSWTVCLFLCLSICLSPHTRPMASVAHFVYLLLFCINKLELPSVYLKYDSLQVRSHNCLILGNLIWIFMNRRIIRALCYWFVHSSTGWYFLRFRHPISHFGGMVRPPTQICKFYQLFVWEHPAFNHNSGGIELYYGVRVKGDLWACSLKSECLRGISGRVYRQFDCRQIHNIPTNILQLI